MAATKADKQTEETEVAEAVEAPTSADTAVEAEAIGADNITVTYDGLTYTVPARYEDWPLEAEIHIEQGHDALSAMALLGDEQWALFMATNPTVKKRRELIDAIMRKFNASGN